MRVSFSCGLCFMLLIEIFLRIIVLGIVFRVSFTKPRARTQSATCLISLLTF